VRDLRFAFVSHLDFNLYRFRLPLMKALAEQGADVFAVSPAGNLSSRFADHGIHHVALLSATDRPPGSSGLLRGGGLTRVLRGLAPDIVHAFGVRANLVGAWAARWAGTPVMVATVSGLGSLYGGSPSQILRLAGFAANMAARLVLKPEAAAIVFQNPDDMSYYVDRGLCRPGQAELIMSSGVDLEEFSPRRVSLEERLALRRDWGIEEDAPVVTMIGRLLRSKGVLEFLQLAERLRGKARFVLIGGPSRRNPESLTWGDLEMYQERGTALLAGFQENIQQWLAITDVFVFPSYYREGVPRTVLEAMAMALPIVTTDSPGCRETVVPGENGILVPPRSVDELERAVASLLDDPDLRTRMGTHSREMAAARFSSSIVVEQHLRLYRRLLGKKSPTGVSRGAPDP